MDPYLNDPDFTLYVGDVCDVLAGLEPESVDCVITSPPYWGLRDYGTGGWEGGDEGCDHRGQIRMSDATNIGRSKGKDRRLLPDAPSRHVYTPYRDVCGKCGARRQDRQLGLESTPEEYVTRMVGVFRQVRRVLAPHGTCWVNIGDSYNGSGPNGNAGFNERYGRAVGQRKQESQSSGQTRIVPTLKPKDLVGIPWKLAFALQQDGWYLRADIIWAKPNPMPESVTDRPTKSHEYVFLLTKQPRYWFDQEAVREPHSGNTHVASSGTRRSDGGAWPNDYFQGPRSGGNDGLYGHLANPAGRNIRSVWEIATQPYPEAHFACVDNDTEALTTIGWKRHDELVDGDEIATYNLVTDRCYYAPASFHRYDYDGELVAIEKRDSSQRLTPNHRCYVRRRSGWTGVVRADELKPGMEILTCAPMEEDRWHDEYTYDVDFAALTGWFVAEGTITSLKRVSIYQSETANPQHVATIRELLDRVGGDWREYRRPAPRDSEVEFVIRGPLATMLQELAPRKRIIDGVLGLSDAARQAMLDALIDGDGHRRKDGRACIVQNGSRQIGGMQALALSLGYRAVVSHRGGSQYVLYLTRGRWLTLRSTDGKHTPISREHYRGVVWCPNVETGFWLARRNGRPFITGNTYPEELVRRCLLAGCPEWVCRTCRKPRERIVGRAPTPPEAFSPSQPSARVRNLGATSRLTVPGAREHLVPGPQTLGWSDCGHGGDYRPGIVLDPFCGSGTTALVARKHGRHAVGVELSAEYAALCAKRLSQQSLFA